MVYNPHLLSTTIRFYSISRRPLFLHLQKNGDLLYALVYIDDIIVTGPSPNFVSVFISNFAKCFSLKDLGKLYFFLGVEVQHNTSGILLSQRKYIHDLLQRHDMLDCKPSTTPMLAHPQLLQNTSTPPCDPTTYRSAVGSLQ
ncbi:uncharacterized mitochondrial protein AtMg00810-like [Impatiens glandulifera]|uniref:uncharacterized mitochondrial protein AtMg00810-like n=1 Tax=Impatiens glandulifera TaxID=253017 RepID=UPI001FB08450|nr:uncharacterized mitochondrial protein AtMg00810-like [Impatiens glandulifera]